ncbi:MAG TPA: DNA polymerase III subunit delta' [Acidiferrobacter sp.]|nr:DNA polymerase III subunit delta' [Acidiferrobacter sp.]
MVTLLSWQQQAWEELPDNSALAHALLISGPSGIGKKVFAHRLAMRLVCEEGSGCGVCRACRFAAAGNHPDVLIVSPEEGKTEITVDSARSLNQFLALTPHMAPRRVALIDAADRLNRSAANAILKTLEEPPAESFLLLVSNAPNRLLPTIRSRCQLLPLMKPERAVALDYLKKRHVAEPLAALAIAHGAPLAAEALPKDALSTALRLLQTLENLASGTEDAPSASETWQAVDLGYGLSLLTDILADLIRLALAGDLPMPLHADWQSRLRTLATRLDLREVFRVWDEALELRAIVDAPLDRRLIWDTLFLSFERLRA